MQHYTFLSPDKKRVLEILINNLDTIFIFVKFTFTRRNVTTPSTIITADGLSSFKGVSGSAAEFYGCAMFGLISSHERRFWFWTIGWNHRIIATTCKFVSVTLIHALWGTADFLSGRRVGEIQLVTHEKIWPPFPLLLHKNDPFFHWV